MTRPYSTWLLVLLPPLLYIHHRYIFPKFLYPTSKQPRQKLIIPSSERVVILGSSSGIGRVIANKYAKRGAFVCVVGRRKEKVDEVVGECRKLVGGDVDNKIIGFTGDVADVDAMERLRGIIEHTPGWKGLDSLIVAAGVSSVKPLLDITPGVHRVVTAAEAALRGNYIGPLVAATTFIPLLSHTSPCPSIHLISSLASVIPAPTRSLYGSTKSASLVLYQALSIERPDINWSYVLPSTVRGKFREGAVDVWPGERDEDGSTPGPLTVDDAHGGAQEGLTPEQVADTSIHAIDTQHSRPIFIPGYMRLAHWIYWVWPGWVEERARRKYGFTV
ncbi:hypothetical protein D9758_014758 [Tetrapyrgos nigripes]|uniref:NAD(P)-binding protein n=1 Tax=Tetrapyrgos nigripes TaxID=182062 RepID=A0A8H5FG18_9AGAR|nr:hypothetical protein D9758_014758 [Tetrapyrgos nigripes]